MFKSVESTLVGKEVDWEESSTRISAPVIITNREIDVEPIKTQYLENLTIQQQVVTVVEAMMAEQSLSIQPSQFNEALVNIISYMPLRVMSYQDVTILIAMSQCMQC